MANKKEIIRDQFITIKVSKEEKELWLKFAEENGINSTRLARNVLMMEAESLINKYYSKYWVKAYIKYAKITKNKEILKRIQTN